MYDNPVFWEHGIFLQPQHFQAEHLHQQRLLANSLALLNPYLWGVRHLDVNTQALNNGVFEVVSLDLHLSTGEIVKLPGNATLSPRSFTEAWKKTEEPLIIYLALAEFREIGANALKTDTPEDSAASAYRFTAPLTPEIIPDLYGDGPQAQVETLRYNLRLYCGDEETTTVWKMPLASLVHDGERVVLDSRFAPPCACLSASRILHDMVAAVRDTMLARSKQLEEYKIVAGEAVSAEGNASLREITLFSILGLLSRNLPDLEQLLTTPGIHPWPVYMTLCRIVGELSVFSATLSPLGETPHGRRALPRYDHLKLFECFYSATNIISRLIDTMVIGPAFSFALTPQSDGSLRAVMPKNALGAMYSYWILLRTAEHETLEHTVSSLAKLAPASDMGLIIAQALPGIRLIKAVQPPAGLPRRSDTLYYMIDQQDPLWHKIQLSGELALMLPDQPSDLTAQITVIQR